MSVVTLPAAERASLAAEARQLIATTTYLTLSTADAAGHPWASPVFFTPDRGRFLWVSTPTTQHSTNIAVRPEVAIVFFDSTVPVGQAQAVYCTARAGLVAEAELDASAAVFNTRLVALGRSAIDDLRDPEPLRLYEAVATQSWVLLRGGDPRNPTGIDARVEVELAAEG